MTLSLQNIIAVILALAFHAAIVALLMMNWNQNAPIDTLLDENYYIERPHYIDATLEKQNPFKVREQRAAETRRQQQIRTEKVAAKRKARLNQEAERQLAKNQAAAVERSRLEKLEIRQAQEQAQIMERQSQIEQQTLSKEQTEEDRRRLEQSLAIEIIEEQDFRRAITDDEKALAFVSRIKREVIQNWSRPPSARNGMQAIVRVRLVPTGEVVDVAIEESSGNDAFDRSAIQAVQKAERFVVPLDPRQFERNFRSFTVLFRPEDLRL